MCGVPFSSAAPAELERAGDVFVSAGGSRSLVYWFRPTLPRRAGGRPVFLCDALGTVGDVGARVSGRCFDVVRDKGSSEGSESIDDESIEVIPLGRFICLPSPRRRSERTFRLPAASAFSCSRLSSRSRSSFAR